MKLFYKQVSVLWHQGFLFYLLKFKYHRKVGVDRICLQHKQYVGIQTRSEKSLHNSEIEAKQQKKDHDVQQPKTVHKQEEWRFRSAFGRSLP